MVLRYCVSERVSKYKVIELVGEQLRRKIDEKESKNYFYLAND